MLRWRSVCNRCVRALQDHTWEMGEEAGVGRDCGQAAMCSQEMPPGGALQKRWPFKAGLIWGERAWPLGRSVSGYRLPIQGDLTWSSLSLSADIIWSGWQLKATSQALTAFGVGSPWFLKGHLHGASQLWLQTTTSSIQLDFFIHFWGQLLQGSSRPLPWEKLSRERLVGQTVALVPIVGLGWGRSYLNHLSPLLSILDSSYPWLAPVVCMAHLVVWLRPSSLEVWALGYLALLRLGSLHLSAYCQNRTRGYQETHLSVSSVRQTYSSMSTLWLDLLSSDVQVRLLCRDGDFSCLLVLWHMSPVFRQPFSSPAKWIRVLPRAVE